jgi:peptidyl-prolyl cis-trans isomerase D
VIYIFRKEMRKWHTVLWVVFAALGISGVYVFRYKHWTEYAVAHVNGSTVTVEEYRHSLTEIQEQINRLRPMARMYGMSEDMFLSTFLGGSKPEELALDMCVREKLMDYIQDPFNVMLNDAWFKNELVKTLPRLTDEQGNVDLEMYQRYLQQLAITPAQFEKRRENELKRDVMQRIIRATSYMPRFVVKDIFDTQDTEKSFTIVRFPKDFFMSIVKKDAIDDKTLEQFYVSHKESYRVGEKRKAKYWEMSPDEYAKKIEIDATMVRNFYEKNKSSLYRIPPKVKVRHILIKTTTDKAADHAKEVHAQAVSKPDQFATLVKKYSQDDKTVAKGGMTELFGKGTYDADFEKSAFRLKTEGEISPITKTKDGYEILQLVQRIQAAEKPFDSVKDDIVKQLRARKSLAMLRGELETLMRTMREEPAAFDQFIQKYGLKVNETDWISDTDTKESGFDGELAKRLFSPYKRQSSVGYFVNEEKYVIYQLAGVEKSYIPAFEKVKDTILKEYYDDKAESLAKNTIKDIRTSLLSKKMTIEQVADKYKTPIVTTKKTKKGEIIPEIKADRGFQEKLYLLSDPSQVMEHQFMESFYIAQVKDITPLAGVTLAQEQFKIIKQEKNKTDMLFSSAFIASLYRNAKIEIDRKMLETRPIEKD